MGLRILDYFCKGPGERFSGFDGSSRPLKPANNGFKKAFHIYRYKNCEKLSSGYEIFSKFFKKQRLLISAHKKELP